MNKIEDRLIKQIQKSQNIAEALKKMLAEIEIKQNKTNELIYY